jgi:putative PIN family toxin of toxin-antitoxin system
MIALRLVIDTNIVVSAALKPDGLQRTVLLLAMSKPASLYVSDAILSEYREVLSRRGLRIRKGLRQQLLQLIRSHSRSVTPRAHAASYKRSRRQQVFGMCRCSTCRLPDHWQSAAFPEVLKKTTVITRREFITIVAPHLMA